MTDKEKTYTTVGIIGGVLLLIWLYNEGVGLGPSGNTVSSTNPKKSVNPTNPNSKKGATLSKGTGGLSGFIEIIKTGYSSITSKITNTTTKGGGGGGGSGGGSSGGPKGNNNPQPSSASTPDSTSPVYPDSPYDGEDPDSTGLSANLPIPSVPDGNVIIGDPIVVGGSDPSQDPSPVSEGEYGGSIVTDSVPDGTVSLGDPIVVGGDSTGDGGGEDVGNDGFS
jgi:hypothetical protein